MLGDHLVPLSPPSQLSTTIVQTAARSAEKAWSRNNNSVETHTRREIHHTKGLHCFSKLIRLLRYNTYLLASLHIIDTSESSSSYFYIDLNFVVRLTLTITPPSNNLHHIIPRKPQSNMVSTAFKTLSFAASLLALTNGVQAQVTATFPNGVTNPDVSRRWSHLSWSSSII